MTDKALAKVLPEEDNWVQLLAFETALEYFTPEDLQLKFDLSPDAFKEVQAIPDFRKAVADYRRQIDDEGIAFRLRARKAAEDILGELYAMAFDQTVADEVRRKAMNDICRYAGYEVQKQEGEGGVKLQIYTNLSLNDTAATGQTYTIEARDP